MVNALLTTVDRTEHTSFVRIIIREEASLADETVRYLRTHGFAFLIRAADIVDDALRIEIELFVLPVDLTLLTMAINSGQCDGVESKLFFESIPRLVLHRARPPLNRSSPETAWQPFLRLLPVPPAN